MNNTIKGWLIEIKKEIDKIHQFYNLNKGAILTEGDLECLLYFYLMNNKCFNVYDATNPEGWKSAKVHSQITWFNEDKESGFEPDITIFNPSNLKINKLSKITDYPNKGYFHDGEAIAIEVKFIRNEEKVNSYSTRDYNKIVNDLSISKINRIRSKYYKNVDEDGIAFVNIVCCKTSEYYINGRGFLKKEIAKTICPPYVFPVIFSHEMNEIDFLTQFPT